MADWDVTSTPNRVTGNALRFQILGPLRVWRDDDELDPGPPQQALLLAVLLARAGRPVSVPELIDVLWPVDPPPSALNNLHKYVGALRHLLEPEIGPRLSGSYLQRRGNAYLFAADPRAHDLIAFRAHVNAARVALATQHYATAMDSYVDALDLWSGPVAAGMDRGIGSGSILAAVDSEFFDAATAAASLAVQVGQPERVIAPLRLGAAMDPLHEPVLASLVTALGVSGRQAEALSVFQQVRDRLVEQLGIEPGPALVAAQLRVLRQTPPSPVTHIAEEEPRPEGGMVGRDAEFGVLWDAVRASLTGGSGLVVTEGEPGMGKTRLLEETATVASHHGVLVAWGRCRTAQGAPALWPWVQIIEALLDDHPSAANPLSPGQELEQLIDPGGSVLPSPVLPDTGAKFRLFEQVVALIHQVSTRRPVLLIVDDLQWADPATLELFGHLASRLPRGIALLGALRDRAPAPGDDVIQLLADVGRRPEFRRVRLTELSPREVAELALHEEGITLGDGAARTIHGRTSGNPFFVRELCRLLAQEGEVTDDAAQRAGIPATVVDVVRDRLSVADDETRRMLEVAAVIGSEVELDELARALDIDAHTCLELVDSALGLGLVTARASSPHALRFAHDVVREAIVTSIPRRTQAAVHLKVADVLADGNLSADDAVEPYAHHLWEAGALADPGRTAGALIRAGRTASARFAFQDADQHLRSAASLARSATLLDVELEALTQLTAVLGMRSGYVGSALDLLERAEQLARHLGRERDEADLLFSHWAAYSQGIQLDRAERLARRLLRHGEASVDPLVRAYGWSAWGIHQWDVGNIGEAVRYLSRVHTTIVDNRSVGEGGRLRRDLQLLWPVMLALNTALHGDLPAARGLLEELEADADDDPYALTVWSAFSVVVAALAGDAQWARRAAERGAEVDPDWSFVFLGAYQRLALCWARAMSGQDPAAAAQDAERIIRAVLVDPPRSGVATWYALLAEMHLCAGEPAEALRALDTAERLLDAHGQRYPEGLILLVRALALRAAGEDAATWRAALRRARALSVSREAHLFAQRADRALGELTSEL